MAGKPQQMQPDDADGVEAIDDDYRPWEPAMDHRSVGGGHVDADDTDPVTAAQGAQVTRQLRLAAAGAEIEDSVVLQIAEGGGEALAAVQRVLVDAQDKGAVQAAALRRLALGELGVDPAHRGRAQAFALTQCRCADPVVVMFEDLVAIRFAAMPAWQDPGKRLHERAIAIDATKTPTGNYQLTGNAKTAQMANPAFVFAFAAQAFASAA